VFGNLSVAHQVKEADIAPGKEIVEKLDSIVYPMPTMYILPHRHKLQLNIWYHIATEVYMHVKI